MMPRSGSRGSTPPTPGNELEDGQNSLDDHNRKTLANMVTTPPVAKEKKKLIFKKVKLFNKYQNIKNYLLKNFSKKTFLLMMLYLL